MVGHKSLEATVRNTYVDAFTMVVEQKNNKVKWITHVRIVRSDRKILATAILAGSYNPEEAMKEWYKLIDGKMATATMKAWKVNEVSGDLEDMTYIGIWLGNILVAEANVQGEFSQNDALADFRINTNDYHRKSGWSAAQGLQLVA